MTAGEIRRWGIGDREKTERKDNRGNERGKLLPREVRPDGSVILMADTKTETQSGGRLGTVRGGCEKMHRKGGQVVRKEVQALLVLRVGLPYPNNFWRSGKTTRKATRPKIAVTNTKAQRENGGETVEGKEVKDKR